MQTTPDATLFRVGDWQAGRGGSSLIRRLDSPGSRNRLEERDAGGKAVHERAAADRANLALREKPRCRQRAEHLLQAAGIVAGRIE